MWLRRLSGDRQGCTPIPTWEIPMGNPYIGPVLRGYVWVFIPEESVDAGTLGMVFIGSQSPFNGLDPKGG